MIANLASRRVGHQFEKAAATHMHQCPVIIRLEIDVRRIDQTLVENRVDAVRERPEAAKRPARSL